MFVITVSKKRIVKIAAIALCVIIAGAAATGVKNFFTKDSAAAVSGKSVKFSTTQEMIEYISSKGFMADIQT
ncbi:MAG: hypothetical protein J6K80_08480, partial [Oscillospiraceae bacterium]|nr:hypothetical protein [Oscillospiraceae bacterium]